MGMRDFILKTFTDDEAETCLRCNMQEIIRCKDCKHKEESVSPSWEAWCNRLHCGCDLDWFCADGERKQS